MTQSIGTNDLIDVWAATGTKVEPDSTKKDAGWTSGERPAYQYMNFLQNLLGAQINYLMRTGIPAWNTDTTYEIGDVVYSAGGIYIALTQNSASTPASEPTDWQLYTVDVGDLNDVDLTGLETDDLLVYDGTDWVVQKVKAANIFQDGNGNIDLEDTGLTRFNAVVQEKTSNYTLAQSDNGTIINVNSTSNLTVTVPTGLSEGFNVTILRYNTGTVTVVEDSTTVNSVDGNLAIKDQYGAAVLTCTGTDEFILNGSLEA